MLTDDIQMIQPQNIPNQTFSMCHTNISLPTLVMGAREKGWRGNVGDILYHSCAISL